MIKIIKIGQTLFLLLLINMDIETPSKWNHIRQMSIKASPRDKELWIERLEEEFQSLIEFIKYNKDNDCDWITIESDDDGIKWKGKCWIIIDHKKYEFDYQFEIPVSYPSTPPEIEIPELDGKTSKMYRGGKICLTEHFFPLWNKNTPKFGITHLLALGLAPWLNTEIPHLVKKGIIF